ncbi:MAG TPA: hypothetical protein VMB05_07515 [Solirubrobacteraceae bacterium]|nr:hypothetical protein [Solirubrobacteraceae bacterium]HUB74474.1 hypothetical protein [Solirubrobacteraceae bacterium]
MALLGITDADVAAFGSLGTFILAAAAVAQIRESRHQTGAMNEQVTAIRDVAELELAAMREDVQASIEQGRAVREAARAQNQPIVFAHIYGPTVKGPDEEDNLAPDEIGFRYRLINEGTGVALNIRHGVELCGIVHEYGDGMEVRSMRPSEELPGRERVMAPAFTVAFREDELPAEWAKEARAYWVSFENVFGETFKTANPHDPHQSAAFMRIEELPSPEV